MTMAVFLDVFMLFVVTGCLVSIRTLYLQEFVSSGY